MSVMKDLKQELCSWRLSRTELGLTKTFLTMRISIYFFIVPALRSIWPREPLAPFSQETESFFGMLWKNLFVFDSTQLGFVASTQHVQGGYNSEQNHAFYPMFPWMANTLANLIGDDHFVWIGLALGLIQSFSNTILLYRVGALLYNDRRMAELAAYLYIASFSALYQITFYSENTFLMYTLLGFYAIYSGENMSQNGRVFDIPRCSGALFGCFFFGASTLTRSTGVLLSIFIAFFMGNAFLVRVTQIQKAVKTVGTVLLCVVVMFAPLMIVVYMTPYVIHCQTRSERDWQGSYPDWCHDKLPNVYTYIQLRYWDNQFLGFLYRKFDHFLTAIPMNIIYLVATYRVVASNPKAFFSLGILNSSSHDGVKQSDSKQVLGSIESIPHTWYMFLQLTLVLLFANADINSRVASTLPLYFWAFSSFVLEESKDQGAMSILGRFACLHNLAFLALNLILFPTEIGFF